MFREFLSSIVRRRGRATLVAVPGSGGAVSVQVARDDVSSGAVPVYPPIDGGIPIMPTAAVMQTQAVLVNRLRRHLALPQSEFERGYLEPIHRAAALVGLLPATKDKHFTGQGGLFRMCLELAVFSAQAADGVMFAVHARIEHRRQVENAWRHAAFFCGLAIELHRPLTEMVIVAADSGETWNPFMGPLNAWAQGAGHERVHVRWVEQAMKQPGVKATAVWSMNYLIGPTILAALHAIDGTIVQTMAGVVSDSITVVDDHTLARVVRQVRRATIERDHALQPSLYGALTQGAHLEPWFLDAMRSLVVEGHWTVNQKGSRLNFGREGCFITWPLGAKDITQQMTDKKVKGVPAREATLAEMLLTAGIIARAPDGTTLWSIKTVHDPSKEVLAVRLSNPAAVLAVLDEQPVPSDEPIVADAPSVAVAQPSAKLAVLKKVQSVDPATGEIKDPASGNAGDPSPASTATPTAPSPANAKTDAGAGNGGGPKPTSTGAETPSTVVAEDKPPRPKVTPVPDSTDQKRSARSRAGAIPEVAPAEPDLSKLDKQIVAALGPSFAAIVAAWVDDWNTTRHPRSFSQEKDGLALKWEYIRRFGIQPKAIATALQANNWLVLAEQTPGDGRPMDIISRKFGDDISKGYMLTNAFARRCGFVLD